MKQLCILLLLLVSAATAGAQGTGIGTLSPAPSAVLDVKSNSKGLLIPRMDSASIAALPSPDNGLMVYDTVKSVLYAYNSSLGAWQRIRPVESLNTLVAGTSAGDVLVWNGTAWIVTPKCNLFSYYYRDRDGDGYGDPYFPVLGCTAPAGFVANNNDCNDSSAAVHPGAVELCNGRDDNCDGQIDEGVNTQTDPLNCGACGNVCNLPNAISGCSGGQCVIIACNTGWANCNGNALDGCEVNLLNSYTNCGNCGHICSLPNATSGCSNGSCVILSCNAGFADCDGNAANGCEVNIANNVNACGSCASPCSFPNASASCIGGSCILGSCSAGYFNADGNAANGCELAAPQLLGSTTSNLSGPAAIAVSGNYAYVVNTTGNNLAIYDISSPASIAFKSSIITGISNPKDVFVSGSYAYVVNATGNTLAVYDVSVPTAIIAKGNISTGISGPKRVFVSGSYAYVTNSGTNALTIYDVSNPATIVYKGSISTNLSNPGEVFVSGGTAYVASTGNNTLATFNISNPLAPAALGTTTTNLTSPVGLTVSGSYAYVLSASNRLSIFDVSNPAAIVAKGITTSNMASPNTVKVSGSIAYVLNGSTPGLVTLNVSNVNAIADRSYTGTGLSTPVSMAVSAGKAYIIQGNTLLIYSLP